MTTITKTTGEFVEAATWYSTEPSYFNDVCVQMSTMAGRDMVGTLTGRSDYAWYKNHQYRLQRFFIFCYYHLELSSATPSIAISSIVDSFCVD